MDNQNNVNSPLASDKGAIDRVVDAVFLQLETLTKMRKDINELKQMVSNNDEINNKLDQMSSNIKRTINKNNVTKEPVTSLSPDQANTLVDMLADVSENIFGDVDIYELDKRLIFNIPREVYNLIMSEYADNEMMLNPIIWIFMLSIRPDKQTMAKAIHTFLKVINDSDVKRIEELVKEYDESLNK